MATVAERAGIVPHFVDAVDGTDPAAQVDMGGPVGALSGKPRSRLDYSCVTSHRNAWKIIAHGADDYAVILEDDVILAPKFVRLLAGDWIPAGTSIVKLETVNEKANYGRLRWQWRLRRGLAELESPHLGAAGYILSRAAARRLLALTDPPSDQVDHLLFGKGALEFHQMPVLQLNPAPVIQGMYHSCKIDQDWATSTLETDRATRGIVWQKRLHRDHQNGAAPRDGLRARTWSILGRIRWAVSGSQQQRKRVIPFG